MKKDLCELDRFSSDQNLGSNLFDLCYGIALRKKKTEYFHILTKLTEFALIVKHYEILFLGIVEIVCIIYMMYVWLCYCKYCIFMLYMFYTDTERSVMSFYTAGLYSC